MTSISSLLRNSAEWATSRAHLKMGHLMTSTVYSRCYCGIRTSVIALRGDRSIDIGVGSNLIWQVYTDSE